MSHKDQPEYFTISTVCPYDGSTSILAICEDMDAVMYRIKQCYTSCGDEYRINCYHLLTASDACEQYTEQQVNKAKYRMEQQEKDRLYKEHTANNEAEFTSEPSNLVTK